MQCISQGFWFEAGRVLFGAAIVGAITLVCTAYYGWLFWTTRTRRKG
jgi:hypothetical protein